MNRIESERFADAREAAPVNGECAERLEGVTMFGSRITFVGGEPVAGILSI